MALQSQKSVKFIQNHLTDNVNYKIKENKTTTLPVPSVKNK